MSHDPTIDPLYAPEIPAPQQQSNINSIIGALAVAAVVTAPLTLASCGGGGGGGGGDTGDYSPTLSFTGIDVRVSTSTTSNITVNDRAQTSAPATDAVAFSFSGAPMVADPGKKAASTNYTFLAHANTSSMDKRYTVTINPAASTVIAAIGTTRFNEAKHLAARTGFGASLDDLLVLAGMTHSEAVTFIVDHMLTEATQAPLSWYLSDINDNEWVYRRQMKEWWLREIVTTPSPLTERMVAFWGNHFVVNVDDIEEPSVAWAWQDFLRANVSGNLRTFAHDMCLHPAMMLYLDNRGNVAVAAPGTTTPKNLPSNENFGRELLELFLLGEGNYTETDVLNVARAFTGHNLDSTKAYVFNATKHDVSTDMVILGSAAANFGGLSGNVYGIIDRIISHVAPGDSVPRTARFVVEKLWTEFIGTPISSNTANITALATTLYAGGGASAWELKPLYKALFNHAEFMNSSTSRKMLKMPLELICGFYRSLGLRPGSERWDYRVYDSGGQDQDPLAPPIVKGWLGGTTWINAKSLLERFENLTNYGWELTDANLPLNLQDSYVEVLLNTTRVFPGPTLPLPSWEKNPFSTLLRSLVKDPAYNIK